MDGETDWNWNSDVDCVTWYGEMHVWFLQYHKQEWIGDLDTLFNSKWGFHGELIDCIMYILCIGSSKYVLHTRVMSIIEF